MFACGRTFQLAADHGWNFVVVFKAGSRPAWWAEFQQLLLLVPGQCVERDLPNGTRQLYRWVNDRDYTDSNGRRGRLQAWPCDETNPKGPTTRFAWLTRFRVTHDNVIALATKPGRYRWHSENHGFNRNTVRLRASHSHLVTCVCSKPSSQKGCDDDAARKLDVFDR